MEKTVNKLDLLGKGLFFLGLTIELVFMIINLGAYEIPEWLNIGRFMQLASALFLCKILLTRYSWKEWIAIVSVIALGIISFIATKGDEWVLRVLVMLIASKNIESRMVAKYILYGTIIGSCVIVFLSMLGIGKPLVNAMDYGRGRGIENRWTLGMGHPNHLHGLLCYLIMLIIYIYYKRMHLYHYLVLTVLNIGLFLLTVSRTGFLVTQFLLCATILVVYWKKEYIKKILFIGGLIAIWGTVFFTIYVGKCGVHGRFLTMLDNMFTGRLTYIDWYGDPATWRLFSQSDDLGRATIDVTYGAIINAYGYVIMFAYTVLNSLLQIRLYKDKNFIGMVILLSCILYGMMENYMNAYFLLYNVIFILIMGNWNRLLQFQKVEQ